MKSTEITTFSHEALGSVRVAVRNGEPWFVANDVCAALGLKNPRDSIEKLDEDEKGVAISDTLGGAQEVNVINESGLYTLTFRSHKPAAKTFKRWVTHEVLPAIRRTGMYTAGLTQTDHSLEMVRGDISALGERVKQLELQSAGKLFPDDVCVTINQLADEIGCQLEYLISFCYVHKFAEKPEEGDWREPFPAQWATRFPLFYMATTPGPLPQRKLMVTPEGRQILKLLVMSERQQENKRRAIHKAREKGLIP